MRCPPVSEEFLIVVVSERPLIQQPLPQLRGERTAEFLGEADFLIGDLLGHLGRDGDQPARLGKLGSWAGKVKSVKCCTMIVAPRRVCSPLNRHRLR